MGQRRRVFGRVTPRLWAIPLFHHDNKYQTCPHPILLGHLSNHLSALPTHTEMPLHCIPSAALRLYFTYSALYTHLPRGLPLPLALSPQTAILGCSAFQRQTLPPLTVACVHLSSSYCRGLPLAWHCFLGSFYKALLLRVRGYSRNSSNLYYHIYALHLPAHNSCCAPPRCALQRRSRGTRAGTLPAIARHVPVDLFIYTDARLVDACMPWCA